MARTPTDPTKAQVWVTKSLDDLDFEFYFPQGPKGDPGGFTTGSLLNATDLNTIVTPGIYRQDNGTNILLLKNYPENSGETGVLIVHQATSSFLEQQWYPSDATRHSRVFFTRSYNYGAWRPWRAYASTRVDQTAGRAIYQWDEQNDREQIVYGDTGWRDVTADLLNGATASTVLIRRKGSDVHLRMSGLKLPSTAVGDPFYQCTTGFVTSTGYISVREDINTGLFGQVCFSGSVFFRGGMTPNNTTHRFTGSGLLSTDQPWPTTLPGTASGSIPNL